MGHLLPRFGAAEGYGIHLRRVVENTPVMSKILWAADTGRFWGKYWVAWVAKYCGPREGRAHL